MESFQGSNTNFTTSKRKRHIMIVAMQDSIHTARWLELIDRSHYHITIFPIYDAPLNSIVTDVDLIAPRAVYAEITPDPADKLPSAADPPPGSRPIRYVPPMFRGPLQAIRRAWLRMLYGVSDPSEGASRYVSEYFMKFVSDASRSLSAPRVLIVDLPMTPAEFSGLDPRSNATVRLGESEQVAPTLFGPHVLAAAIAKIKPDVIHSMEFQHCGYLVLAAKEKCGSNFPVWIAANWGSDIYYYGRFEDHRRQIVRLLSSIDAYSTECYRDVLIAQRLGYSGPTLPVVPVSGGFDLNLCRRLRSDGKPSQRRLVIMKGYEHFAGRAVTTLEILRRNADLLVDYEIVCFSLTPNVRDAIVRLQKDGALNIKMLSGVPYEDVLAHYGRARVYIGLGISDGISTAVLESMVMGCFPIQTSSSCCNEWLTDGIGGFIVDIDDVDSISSRLRHALTDDDLVDRAEKINWEAARRRLGHSTVKRQVAEFYDQAFAPLSQFSRDAPQP